MLHDFFRCTNTQVTLLDAGHCPGAALFLFRLPATSAATPLDYHAISAAGDGTITNTPSIETLSSASTTSQTENSSQRMQLQWGKAILHTGDMRFHTRMLGYKELFPFLCSGFLPQWQTKVGGAACGSRRLDALFLDTTYCAPQHDFPLQVQTNSVEQLQNQIFMVLRLPSFAQETVVQAVLGIVRKHSVSPRTLFVFGTYTIGKEKLFMEVIYFGANFVIRR